MRILLTGATGFIGSHLARLLINRGVEVYAPIREQSDTRRITDLLPKLHISYLDLLDQKAVFRYVEEIRPDLCFHLAWYVESGKYLTSEQNLAHMFASVELARILHQVGCRRLVISGSCAEYDLSREEYLHEGSPTKATNLYSATKIALEMLLRQVSKNWEMAVVWARIFYIYGPGEDQNRLVPAIILPSLRGEPTQLTLGQQVRDYLHVGDVATALWAIMDSDVAGVVNVGNGQPITVADIARQIGNTLNCPELIRLGDLPYRHDDPMFVCADNRLLKSLTVWKPHFDLVSGLENTISWWKNHI